MLVQVFASSRFAQDRNTLGYNAGSQPGNGRHTTASLARIPPLRGLSPLELSGWLVGFSTSRS